MSVCKEGINWISVDVMLGSFKERCLIEIRNGTRVEQLIARVLRLFEKEGKDWPLTYYKKGLTLYEYEGTYLRGVDPDLIVRNWDQARVLILKGIPKRRYSDKNEMDTQKIEGNSDIKKQVVES